MPRTASVAVIIPCYNDGATVGSAVASALLQSIKPEVLVIDDGSTQRATRDALAGLAREGVTVLRIEHAGLSAARTAGLMATEADYLFALDADDRLAPDALQPLVAALDTNPGAAAAWGDYERFGETRYIQRTARVLDPWHVTYQNDIGHALFRRSALLEVGGWTLEPGYEDWDVWMSFAERGWSGVRVPVITHYYRAHGNRMLSEEVRRHESNYEVLRARHRQLFRERRRNWGRSAAPAALKLALPLIDRLPLHRGRKRQIGGLACHLAHRRGMRVLLRRLRTDR